MADKTKIAVLISGRGSNLQAILEKCQEPNFPASVELVMSNKASALGLQRAAEAGIKTSVIKHKDYPTRDDFEIEMHKVLLQNNIEFICLAGFMRVLTQKFVEKWQGKMINIHPSLLPKHKGLNTHARAIEAKDEFAGCTVHYVSTEVDSGEIISQRPVKILGNDTPETLAARVLQEEHKCFKQALQVVFKDQHKAS